MIAIICILGLLLAIAVAFIIWLARDLNRAEAEAGASWRDARAAKDRHIKHLAGCPGKLARGCQELHMCIGLVRADMGGQS